MCPADQSGAGAQWHHGINHNVDPHAPPHCLQQDLLTRHIIQRHQPRDEALVTSDTSECWCAALTHGHCPCHARVEIIVHADGETWRFGRRTRDGHRFCSVAVPRVADAIRVTNGLYTALTQLWQLPARPAVGRNVQGSEVTRMYKFFSLIKWTNKVSGWRKQSLIIQVFIKNIKDYKIRMNM